MTPVGFLRKWIFSLRTRSRGIKWIRRFRSSGIIRRESEKGDPCSKQMLQPGGEDGFATTRKKRTFKGDYEPLKKRRSTAALIGSPELFSNPDNASCALAFYCVRIVNNSAGTNADLFRAGHDSHDLSMKIWRSGRPRTRRTILWRIVWRSFGPSAYSEPDEPLAKGSIKSHCKYFTAARISSVTTSIQILIYEKTQYRYKKEPSRSRRLCCRHRHRLGRSETRRGHSGPSTPRASAA